VIFDPCSYSVDKGDKNKTITAEAWLKYFIFVAHFHLSEAFILLQLQIVLLLLLLRLVIGYCCYIIIIIIIIIIIT
jgi:hypothetical protein